MVSRKDAVITAGIWIQAAFIIWLIFSCNEPAGENNVPALATPAAVTAERCLATEAIRLNVAWQAVQGADAYKVYRSINNAGFLPLKGAETTALSWTDAAFPIVSLTNLKTVRYAVQSISGVQSSSLSIPSNSVDLQIMNVKTIPTGFKNKIRIDWDGRLDATAGYRIYRFIRNNSSYLLDNIFSQACNLTYFEDTTGSTSSPLVSRPYFYQVTWLADTMEYGQSTPLVFGLYYNESDDKNEPNDDYMQSKQLNIDAAAVTAVSYSYGEGVDSLREDEDWYSYSGTAGQSLIVKVCLPVGSPFLASANNPLYFQFLYHGILTQANRIDQLSKCYVFSNFWGATGDVDIYFRIFPGINDTRNVIGTYTVAISHNM